MFVPESAFIEALLSNGKAQAGSHAPAGAIVPCPTVYDGANKAWVSISTVPRVLNARGQGQGWHTLARESD
jgi:hypothetical protein